MSIWVRVCFSDFYCSDYFADETMTMIHLESSIKAAKERRERLRKTGLSTEDDFISLSVTRREDVDQGPHPESRLIREEDELGEGDDGTTPCYMRLRLLALTYPCYRIRRVHQCAGTHRARQESEKEGSCRPSRNNAGIDC